MSDSFSTYIKLEDFENFRKEISRCKAHPYSTVNSKWEKSEKFFLLDSRANLVCVRKVRD